MEDSQQTLGIGDVGITGGLVLLELRGKTHAVFMLANFRLL